MAEVVETPPEVQPAQVQAPPKEPFFTWLKKRVFGSPTPPATPPPENQQVYQGGGLSGTRTTEQILEQVGQTPTAPEQPQERIPAPSDPDYEPLTNESPVPAPEREAQLRYAAQQRRAEQAQPPASTPSQQGEEGDTSKPAWSRKKDQELSEGYAQEAIRQAPQTPGTGVPTEQAPTTYESPFSTPSVETQAPTPGADTSFAQKVLDTPVEELEKEVPEGATEALREAGGANTTIPVKEPAPLAQEKPIPVRIPQEEEVPT